MASLDGTGRRVELGRGISVQAPGLRGDVDLYDVTPGSATRAADVTGARGALDLALDRADVHRVRAISLAVTGSPFPVPGGLRTPTSDEPGIVVDVPDLGPDVAQVLLAADEGGVTTWNFPVGPGGGSAPTSRGTGGDVRFVVRQTTPTADEGTASRGLLGAVGRKVFELLTIPLAKLLVPPTARAAAEAWESRARTMRVRPFGPEDRRSEDVAGLDEEAWQDLAKGRSLWLVHGTFSTAAGGFGGVPGAALAALREQYGGRVVAFDHFTLGPDPVGNVAALAALVPPGLDLEVDVVAHSRGGLVARAMAGEGGIASPVHVRRVVHVATPNHGTTLADPAHLCTLLDRVTTLLNLAPDGPLDVVATSLSIVLSVVRTVAQYGIPALPGLAAMDPAGDFLAGLGAAGSGGAVHYAVASDYEPTGALRRWTRGPVGDFVVDRVFGSAANDLVVPTDGVYEGTDDTSFVVDPRRRLVLPSTRGIDHSGYFGQPDVMAAVTRWLVD